jgi:hypothetical protein
MKYLALLVCASALFVAGCSNCCQKKAAACSAAKPSCGHQCCIDAKTDCAHCPKCSHK